MSKVSKPTSNLIYGYRRRASLRCSHFLLRRFIVCTSQPLINSPVLYTTLQHGIYPSRTQLSAISLSTIQSHHNPCFLETSFASPLFSVARLKGNTLKKLSRHPFCRSLSSSAHSATVSPEPLRPSTIFDYFDKTFPKAKRSYNFSHAATGFPKRGKKSTITPEEDTKYVSVQIGEDAYFRRYDALGVADGVGGWSHSGTKGANPALYSRKLMHYAYMELEKYDNIDDPEFNDYVNAQPAVILERSYKLCSEDAERESLVGSSTALIALLRNDELRVANLGDCGISVIRHNDFIFRTEEQQHSFNYPFQLGSGRSSPGNSGHFDTPQDALCFKIKVKVGDIVIVGSDGIYDNLFDEDILAEVLRFLPTGGTKSLARMGVNLQAMSDALARKAKSISEDTRNMSSPFQTRAMQEGLYYQGGKADDISVIVGMIIDSEDSPDRRL